MSKNEELKDQELETVVGGAKTQQAASESGLELEEFEPTVQNNPPRVSDIRVDK